jgi:hypothetical protein
MVRFTSTVDVAAGVDRVWQRITDWPAHARWIPLTAVRVTSDRPDGVGARFVGTSALGPLGFDDPMEIVEWTPPADGRPGYCRVRKHGRVLLGWADLTVQRLPDAHDARDDGTGAGDDAGEAGADGHTRVSWTEEVQVVPVLLTRPFDRLITAGAKIGFDRTLRLMARELEAEVRAGG